MSIEPHSNLLRAADVATWPDPELTDPRRLGWMEGSPPAIGKLIRFADGDHLTFPKSRWSLSHLRELMPTANVSRGDAPPSRLPSALQSFDDLTFVSMHGETLSWRQSLLRTYFDGVVVLHRGVLVFEDYFGEGARQREHAMFSVTKSLVGTMAATLVHDGVVDATAPVGAILPELKTSAFGDATVREVMDMLVGVGFSENYADPNSGIWSFSRAGGLRPSPTDYNGPCSFAQFLTNLKKDGEHGAYFSYKTVTAQVLSWIIEKVTGSSLASHLSTSIWQQLGVAHDASITVDSHGAGFGGGGMCATVRDMARFGEMMRNGGRKEDLQIVPEAVVVDIQQGGDRERFARAELYRATLRGWSYRSQWWISHDEHRSFMARGIHGQCIYVDPVAEMVIARTASHPVALSVANDPITLPAFAALGRFLAGSL
ncbi:serine hydrolase domain-containing protein [Variovorax sp. GT1P44]|uniref:serine hydrolase domain-containing protein n=1 Tax=Variovorax sp. GT1P44 TaxID=3443742 RepID=UPI003F46ED05